MELNIDILTIAITAVVSLLVGFLITSTLIKRSIERKSQHIIKDAQAEAEVIKKDKILQAKEKFLQLKAEHEKQIRTMFINT